MSMVSVCLPSDALLQHLPSYLGFSYLEQVVSLHSCSSKAQPLLLILDEGYLLIPTVPDLQRGIAPLGPPVPAQAPLLRLLLPPAAPGLGLGVAPQSHCPWLQVRGGFSWPPLTSDAGCLLPATTGLRHGVAPPGCRPDLGCGVAPEVIKQEMARVNVNILGISELKWTGLGEFNSDDHYIYYCGQESLRRNGVAIMVNKRVQNAVLGCSPKNNRMISVHLQGKPFNISLCPNQ